ncbi:MAG: peptidyl-prolyl cis-trans isomerase [Actinomycetota bacterium]|jgi:peptidyl-prolyl cis-trans isomerase B (cyclophilin B)|nr:peptidyl-prolyl cis-trans isomerase [Actinomycetota bacterium]
MTDLEQLFQDAAALAEEGETAPLDPVGSLRRARSAARRRRWTMLAVPASAALAVVAVAVATSSLPIGRGSDPSNDREGLGSAPSPTAAAGTPCSYQPTPSDGSRGTKVGVDVGLPPATATHLPAQATVHTNRGDITLSLRAQTPCTVNSFAHLAGHAYYDETPCHRLVTQGIFALQCGDPSARGTGGPGYTYPDEALEGTTYPAGTVAMANSGPDTNGSQFFFVYEESKLGPNYTAFGRITAGLDVLVQIAAAGTTPANDGRPNQPVQITSVSLE